MELGNAQHRACHVDQNPVTGFGDLESLIEAQLVILEAQLMKIRAGLPEGTTLGDTIKAVQAAIAAATAAGVDPEGAKESEQRQAQLDALTSRDPNTVQNLQREIARARQSEDSADQFRLRPSLLPEIGGPISQPSASFSPTAKSG